MTADRGPSDRGTVGPCRQKRPFGATVPRCLGATLGLLITTTPLSAQAIALPYPCQALGREYTVKQCLVREVALVDSLYLVTARAAAAAQPAAARDSFAGAERAWAAENARQMALIADATEQAAADLVAKRRRTFVLRHSMVLAIAAGDTSRMRRIPLVVDWRQAVQQERGLVLTLTNPTNRPVDVYARLYNPLTDQLRVRDIRVLPSANVRISWIDDWDWGPGMPLQLLSEGYAPFLALAAVGTAR